MELSIILTTTLLTTSPDLCAEVYVDANGEPYTDAAGQTWSRYCEPAGPSAPILDLEVCCAISGDDARCSLPNLKGRCARGTTFYYCAHGDVTSTGAVVCYNPLRSICDFGFCSSVQRPDAGPLEDSICCSGSSCWNIWHADEFLNCYDIGGYTGYCKNGATNADGSVDCFE
ncbi:MAG: hypothetical protein R6X02_13060 [Enhygromyxa sp.]